MEDRIRIFLNNYINGLYFPTVHLTDVIEILIITVIVYEIMLWIKNTSVDALKRDDHAGGILFACRDL
jgi:hypothetical protein